MIIDTRGVGDLVAIMWLVPEMVSSDVPGAAALTDILRKYAVILASHGHLDQRTMTYSFEDISTIDVSDLNGRPLVAVARDDLPPVTSGALAAMETSFRQTVGALGKGMKLYIFNAADVDSCGKGGISARYAGETYTWQTPVPGCPSR